MAVFLARVVAAVFLCSLVGVNQGTGYEFAERFPWVGSALVLAERRPIRSQHLGHADPPGRDVLAYQFDLSVQAHRPQSPQ